MPKSRKLYHFSIAGHGSSSNEIAELLRVVANELDSRPKIKMHGLTVQDLTDEIERPSITVYYDRNPEDKTPEEYSMNATTVGPTKRMAVTLADAIKVVETAQLKDVYDMTLDVKTNGSNDEYAITIYGD